MQLTYLVLDRNNPAVRRALANAYEMHRTILAAFDDVASSARQELGILYRIFCDREMRLYVIHKAMANWGKIVSQGFVPARIANNPKAISSVAESFQKGNIYTFDILCAPTKKVRRDNRLSNRIFIQNESERLAWLLRKGEQNGFSVIENSVYESCQEKILINKMGCEKAALAAVRFQGELAVTDTELFKGAFTNGIGSGKAFGLGMLMLFPRRL